MPTTAADVRAMLDALAVAGVQARVGGGWGIAALVGRQTREHRDLDLGVPADLMPLAVATLADQGLAVTTDWLPVRVELSDGRCFVDLHPLHFAADGSAWQAGLDETTFRYPADAWTSGRIGDRPVRCLAVFLQRQFHSGYPPRAVDRHDLALLDELAP